MAAAHATGVQPKRSCTRDLRYANSHGYKNTSLNVHRCKPRSKCTLPGGEAERIWPTTAHGRRRRPQSAEPRSEHSGQSKWNKTRWYVHDDLRACGGLCLVSWQGNWQEPRATCHTTDELSPKCNMPLHRAPLPRQLLWAAARAALRVLMRHRAVVPARSAPLRWAQRRSLPRSRLGLRPSTKLGLLR